MPSPSAPDSAPAPPAGADATAWFDAVPSALLRVDAGGSVLAANAAARALLGAGAALGNQPLAQLGLDLASLPTEPVPYPGTERWLSLRALPLAGCTCCRSTTPVNWCARDRHWGGSTNCST